MSEREKLVREGLVIVVSILLAFSIDAGWDELLERREESAVLRGLAADFDANRAEAAGTIEAHQTNSGLLNDTRRLTTAQVRSLPVDSVAKVIAAMASPRTFDPVRGSLDALIGSGRLDLVRDEELRRALVVFLNLVDDAEEDARYLRDGSLSVWDRRIALGGPWRVPPGDLTPEACSAPVRPSTCYLDPTGASYLPDPTSDDLVRLLEDNEFMGRVNQLRVHVDRYVAELRRIEAQVGRVADLLEAELR